MPSFAVFCNQADFRFFRLNGVLFISLGHDEVLEWKWGPVGEGEPKKETRTVAEKLVVEGIAALPAPGRADDFGGAAPPVAAASAPPAAAAAAGAAGASALSGQAATGPAGGAPAATAADQTTVIDR